MAGILKLPKKKIDILHKGRVFVPSPLALSSELAHNEKYQRLLTLYYIRSGAAAVIPGAHTGEFSLGDPDIYHNWLKWVKEMTTQYGENMILIAAVSGKNFMKQVELAVRTGYDLILLAPTAFSGKKEQEVIRLVREITGMIPVMGFELQKAIPGAYSFSAGLWNALFDILYGAKGASFNTYLSLRMLEAAARSTRSKELVLLTGNDDRIVDDLSGEYDFKVNGERVVVDYKGGLLGHLATDTHAASKWVHAIFEWKKTGAWDFPISRKALAHAVNRCNMALFDALGNFENSVWGVKYRLYRLGLLPGPYCMSEKGRKGQAESIDSVYTEYPGINDEEFLAEHLKEMKREVGIRE